VTLLERYARGETEQALAVSVEAHLIKCETCRASVRGSVSPARLARMWGAVLDEIDGPSPDPIERALFRIGVPDHVARLLAATPSLRLSWLLAVATALSFGVVAAHQSSRGLALFLIVAPLLPLAGVAVAFGPGVDPTYEIGLASPMRSLRLLLIRAAAVLATTAPLAALAGLLLPVVDWRSAAWLLPSLALTTMSLALSTVISPLRGAIGLAVVWIAASVGAAWMSSDVLAAFRAGPQLAFAIIALASSAALVLRRDMIEMRSNR
jgi:hypothetical protein